MAAIWLLPRAATSCLASSPVVLTASDTRLVPTIEGLNPELTYQFLFFSAVASPFCIITSFTVPLCSGAGDSVLASRLKFVAISSRAFSSSASVIARSMSMLRHVSKMLSLFLFTPDSGTTA